MLHRETELLAVGAGPSNLALAVALEEIGPPDLAEQSVIVERNPAVEWQSGLLLPWARSQVGFIKDLATMRDPCSRFSFLNFLHTTGRLDEFVNMGRTTPYRQEIAAYLAWVADNLEHVRVELGRRCTRIEPRRGAGGRLAGWTTWLANGSAIDSRYLVVGTGRDPQVPQAFAGLSRGRVVHSSAYTQRITEFARDVPYRVTVVGGGQSAAEMFHALREDLPHSDVTWLMRSIGLASDEATRFNNELFYPSYVDEFFNTGADGRARILEQMYRTNYASTAPWLLDALYEERYLDRLAGRDRRRIVTMSEVTAARDEDGEAVLDVYDRRTGETTELRSDVVFLGTGYVPRMPALVQRLATALGQDEVTVSRSYRMVTGERTEAACYLQGVNEETHGISDSLLSVLAHRATDIVGDICARRGPARRSGPTARTGRLEPVAAGHRR